MKWKLTIRGIVFDKIRIEIIPGEGGEDANLFSRDLANAYARFSFRYNFKCVKLETKRGVCL